MKKLFACLLSLTLVFLLASCGGDKNNENTDNKPAENKPGLTDDDYIYSEDLPKDDSNEENSQTEPTEAPENSEGKLVGRWAIEKAVSMSEIAGSSLGQNYNSPIVCKVVYTFNSDGTFAVSKELGNIEMLRQQLRDIAVDLAREQAAAAGAPLSYDLMNQAKEIADDTVDKLNSEMGVVLAGEYSVKKDKINYVVQGKRFYEKFKLDGNKLIITGSSSKESSADYPITYYKD